MAVTWVGYGGSSLLGSTLTMTEGAGSGFYSEALSGKVYMEFYQTSGLDFMYLGIGGADYPYDWNFRPTEVSYASSAVYDPRTARCGMAVDVSAGKFWIRNEAGNWTIGDPETGTGGYDIPVGFTENRITFGNAGAGAGTIVFDIFTVSGDFTYAVPTGFTALDDLPTPTVYWTLDTASIESGAFKADTDTADNRLTITGSVPTTSGYITDGASFSGNTSNYLTAVGTGGLNKVEELDVVTHTLSCWVNLNTITGSDQMLISNCHFDISAGSADNSGNAIYIMSDGRVRAAYLTQNSETFTDSNGWGGTSYAISCRSPNILNVGEWYHITATFSLNTIKLYINGVEVSNVTGVGNHLRKTTTNSAFSLGAQLKSGSPSRSLDGTIDEVKAWDSTLSASQVTELYQASVPSTTYEEYIASLSPVAYWRLGESSGTTATDETGNYDLTYINTPTLGEASLIPSDTGNTSATFNGSDQHALLNTADFLSGYTGGTILATIKPNTSGLHNNYRCCLHK